MTICRVVRQARIDVPLLGQQYAYMFVGPVLTERNPWWQSLFDYLVSLPSPQAEWRHEPVQDVYVARPDLSDCDKAELYAILKSAPEEELSSHRTLRRASQLTPVTANRLRVTFFSGSDTTAN
jgi:hypothetical protein